tara:strand:- start:1910 stop:2056 length:147 start_codon:yes stop_codon:yes gene_type:complete
MKTRVLISKKEEVLYKCRGSEFHPKADAKAVSGTNGSSISLFEPLDFE